MGLLGRLGRVMPLLGLITLWDACTTVLGTIFLLGGLTIARVIIGVVVSAAMMMFFFLTFDIWNETGIQTRAISGLFQLLWWLTLLYDLFTSFYGNSLVVYYGIEGISTVDDINRSLAENPLHIVFIGFASVIVSGCTVIAAWVAQNRLRTD